MQRVLDGSAVPLCLDTGHLLIGGTDPVALARSHPDRIAHAHLKDVDAAWADRVRGRATRPTPRRSRPGCTGRSARATSTSPPSSPTLEAAGYDGWYVLEQDTILGAGAGRRGPGRRRAGQHRLPAEPGVSDQPAVRSFDVLTIGRVGVDVYPLQVGVGWRTSRPSASSSAASATNVAVAAARHGRRTAVITRTGDDPFGEFIHRRCASSASTTGSSPRCAGLPTPVTFCEIFPPDDFPLYFYRLPKAPDLEIRPDELDLDAIRVGPGLLGHRDRAVPGAEPLGPPRRLAGARRAAR